MQKEVKIHSLPNSSRISEKAAGKIFKAIKKEGVNYMVIIPNEFLTNLFETIENRVLNFPYSCIYLHEKFCYEQ